MVKSKLILLVFVLLGACTAPAQQNEGVCCGAPVPGGVVVHVNGSMFNSLSFSGR